MKMTIHRLSLALLAGFAVVALTSTLAPAQYTESYGSYYQKQARRQGGGGPGTSVNRYLYDKYFYTQQGINPAMSLSRRSSISSYYQNVLPEQQRREAFQQASSQYIQERKLQGNVGHTNYGFANELRQGVVPSPRDIPRTPASTPYYQQYYGGRR